MSSSEEILKWMSGSWVEGMPKNPRSAKRKKTVCIPGEEIARKAGVDLDKMKAMAAKHDKRYSISADGADAVLNFGKFKGFTVSRLVDKEPQYLRWMLTAEFPEALADIVRYQLKIPSVEAGRELHGKKAGEEMPGLVSPVRSLDGIKIADWPGMIRASNPCCPKCELDFRHSYAVVKNVLDCIDQYIFSCGGCGTNYKYSYKKRKTYPV